METQNNTKAHLTVAGKHPEDLHDFLGENIPWTDETKADHHLKTAICIYSDCICNIKITLMI